MVHKTVKNEKLFTWKEKKKKKMCHTWTNRHETIVHTNIHKLVHGINGNAVASVQSVTKCEKRKEKTDSNKSTLRKWKRTDGRQQIFYGA